MSTRSSAAPRRSTCQSVTSRSSGEHSDRGRSMRRPSSRWRPPMGDSRPQQLTAWAGVRARRRHLVPRDVPAGGSQSPTGHELPSARWRRRDPHEHARRRSLRRPGGRQRAGPRLRGARPPARPWWPRPQDARPGVTDASRTPTQNGLFSRLPAERRRDAGAPSSSACTRRYAPGSGSSTAYFGSSMPGQSRSRDAACSSSGSRSPQRVAGREDPSGASSHAPHSDRGQARGVEARQGTMRRVRSSDNLHFDHIIPWSRGGSR